MSTNFKFAYFFPTSTGKLAWSGETRQSLLKRASSDEEKEKISAWTRRAKAGDFMFLDDNFAMVMKQRD